MKNRQHCFGFRDVVSDYIRTGLQAGFKITAKFSNPFSLSTASQKLILRAMDLTTVCVTDRIETGWRHIQRSAVDHRADHLQIFECGRKNSVLFSADKAPSGIRSKSGLTTVFTTDKHGTRGNSGRKKLGEQVSWSGNGMKARKAHERTDPRQLGW